MGIQIITTETGEELVVLARRDYDALLARLGDEEAEDRMTLRLAEEARSAASLPAEVSMAILRGESRLAAIRAWRGLDTAMLASRLGMDTGTLTLIEAGERTAERETLARLACLLDVPEDWLD